MDALDAEMNPGDAPVAVPDDLVRAALRAAERLGRDVAAVSVASIAQEAGMSRSTLLRRLGGSRAALDDAVRASGVDPGGRSVRTRAVHAAAVLIGEVGLASTTLEAIATAAGCSVDSLYAVFGNRDTLLGATFDQYGPIMDIEDVLATEHPDLTATVRDVYRVLTEGLSRQPQVTPAIIAEAFARPTSPAVQSLINHSAPRLFAVIGAWLTAEIRAGRVRDLPVPVLMSQFMAPVLTHMLLRPGLSRLAFVDLPDVDAACDIFAENFVRAIAIEPNSETRHAPTGTSRD